MVFELGNKVLRRLLVSLRPLLLSERKKVLKVIGKEIYLR
jgi:hypothetical protein